MKVKFVWKNCDFLNGEWSRDKKITSFWIEIEPEEIEEIIKYVDDPEGFRAEVKEHQEENEKLTFLVSQDLQSIVCLPEYYPYSGQWAINPFEEIQDVEITQLSELKELPSH